MLQSLIQNHMPMCTVSLLESREKHYVKAMNNSNINHFGVSDYRSWIGFPSFKVTC